jgi:ABC-type oligopeptide transport system substrate-binding subunit
MDSNRDKPMNTAPRVPWWTVFAMTGAGVFMLALFLGPRNDLAVLPRPVADRDVLRVAYVQQLTPDPHVWTFPLPVNNQFILSLWEPLIECDPENGQPQAAAAVSWRWSEDRLSLELRLRADGRWCNGEPVTAHDFVRGWRRLIRQNLDCAAVLFPVKNAEAIHRGELADTSALGVEAVDDFTLRIQLNAVRSTFVAELADPLLVPLHATTAAVLENKAYRTAPGTLITNGAFRLVQAKAEGYRLALSPHYRDRNTILLSGVEFIRADGAAMARLLVAVGRADLANPPAIGAPAGLPTARCVTEETEMAMSVVSLDLNVARGPLRDVRVRRALALAMNRAGSIAEADADRLVPAYSWVPDMPGRPGLPLMHEDEAEARRLLAEAGYPGGKGFPVLILPVNQRRPNFGYLQVWTERWYRVLGVRTYLAFDPPEKHKLRYTRGEFDVMQGGLMATVPDAGDLLGLFAHPERFDAPHWANPEITRLMAEANRRSGLERLALLERIERSVMEDVPTIPMIFERRRTLLGVEVAGWYADPLGRQAFKRLAITPVEHGEFHAGGPP